jgi:hypothetical protein
MSFHSIYLKKRGAMMQKANVRHEEKDGQDGEKEIVTLRSSLKVVA